MGSNAEDNEDGDKLRACTLIRGPRRRRARWLRTIVPTGRPGKKPTRRCRRRRVVFDVYNRLKADCVTTADKQTNKQQLSIKQLFKFSYQFQPTGGTCKGKNVAYGWPPIAEGT